MPDLLRRRLLLSAAAAGLLPTLPGAHVQGGPPIAVCLGSGGVHGRAHVGVIRAFQRLGLQPDIITGTSVGAIAGVLWAAGYAAQAIETIADDPNWKESSGLRLPVLGLGKLDGLRELITRRTGGLPIEALATRFAALATDLDSGQPVILDRGPAGPAVAASCSVPLRYEPVTINDRRLVDGALSAPVPVDAARQLGAGFTIAIDVAYRPDDEPIRGIGDVAFQMFHIMVNRLIAEQIVRADFAIRLDAHEIMSGGAGLSALVGAGDEAVSSHWPALQSALQRAGIDRDIPTR
ncbi:MAG: patatin-like phospholipase family protein [Gammaproteobacteria bacterium]|nr:patatin-like phospholipase family protein [Gammaproteobacteria bacterium]